MEGIEEEEEKENCKKERREGEKIEKEEKNEEEQEGKDEKKERKVEKKQMEKQEAEMPTLCRDSRKEKYICTHTDTQTRSWKSGYVGAGFAFLCRPKEAQRVLQRPRPYMKTHILTQICIYTQIHLFRNSYKN